MVRTKPEREQGPPDEFSRLWRILNAARLGLATEGGDRGGDGPGSDRQLARKVAQCILGLMELGMEAEEEGTRHLAPGTTESGAGSGDQGACRYPDGCHEWARRDGLCVKHLIWASKGDAKALAVIAEVNRPGGPATAAEVKDKPPTAAGAVQKGPAAAAGEAERNGAEMAYRCDQCEKTFDSPHGLRIHKARVHAGQKGTGAGDQGPGRKRRPRLGEPLAGVGHGGEQTPRTPHADEAPKAPTAATAGKPTADTPVISLATMAKIAVSMGTYPVPWGGGVLLLTPSSQTATFIDAHGEACEAAVQIGE
jgi:hypothetical protein